jgi:hypothetical protein
MVDLPIWMKLAIRYNNCQSYRLYNHARVLFLVIASLVFAVTAESNLRTQHAGIVT